MRCLLLAKCFGLEVCLDHRYVIELTHGRRKRTMASRLWRFLSSSMLTLVEELTSLRSDLHFDQPTCGESQSHEAARDESECAEETIEVGEKIACR